MLNGLQKIILLSLATLLLPPGQGLMLDVVPKGDTTGGSQALRLCKPFKKDIYEVVKVINPATHKFCPGGTLIWYWDFGSVELSETKDGDEYHTLIQIAGGPNTEADPGITNVLDEEEYLLYGTLKRDAIFRSLFKIKREDRYLHLEEEDDLRVGDILEFWGPSNPGQRGLFLSVFGPDSFGLRRAPFSEDPTTSPEIELRVRAVSASNTKSGSRPERDRLSGQSPINRSTSLALSPRKKKKTGCLTRVCNATAGGLGSIFRGAKNFFSGAGDRSQQRSRAQDPRRFLDNLATFADRSGTGRVRLRDSVSRQLTQNSEPSVTSVRRQSNRGDVPELTPADEEGSLPVRDLPRLLNLGPSGLRRVLNYALDGGLAKITEGTEGTGIDTHAEIRTPGLVDTRPVLNTMTTSRPDTHGHFSSEILISPKNPEIAENPEEEEDEEEELSNNDKDDGGDSEEDTSSLSITISEDANEDAYEDVEVNNPPMLETREGGPGASKGALDLSKVTSTRGSQPVPVDKQLRRSKHLMESYSEELE
ncbi:hypothetical protein TWF481_000543 [Arthrobotrys musiformis]|uniref:Uncharacterized protein n=1 Tax=Arthrobotrys musiformis TaxID=47236 RepID=A0AAV9WMX4_9PEZI